MKNRDIIVVGIQSWDIKIGSNCKNIAMEFAKDNRVLYVNAPLSRMVAIREKGLFHRSKREIRKISDNLMTFYPKGIIESISSLSNAFLFDILNKHNNRIFAREIRKAIEILNFRDYIIFCDSDMYRSFYLKELLKPKLFVYYTRDNLLAIRFWQTQGLRIEPLLMKKSDLVLANSHYLMSIARKYNPESYFVGQGCDLSLFRKDDSLQLPPDIAEIPKPVIGYIGTLVTLRLDPEIIRHIAVSRPDWSVVLVGPEDEGFKTGNLHDIPNIRFLGSKKETELPLYLQAFNVAINPQIISELTIGNYPRKIDEYLAMGKPVVATKTMAMEYFSDYVSLVDTRDEWITAIESEIAGNTKEKEEARISFAHTHNWENNVNEIYKQTDRFL